MMRVRCQLRKATEELLGQLGESPGTVAGRLGGYGIRGVRSRSTDCPLSRYLQLMVGADPRVCQVDVHRRSVRLALTGIRRSLTVALPPPARLFVDAFDAGGYPDLVVPPGAPSPLRRLTST